MVVHRLMDVWNQQATLIKTDGLETIYNLETKLIWITAKIESVGIGIDVDALPFEAAYGRTSMEYYDGFVFGFSAAGHLNIPPVATGGRYDALTVVLGGGKGVPAVGGVIRPDLVALAEGAI